jgi:hypothetical protein
VFDLEPSEDSNEMSLKSAWEKKTEHIYKLVPIVHWARVFPWASSSPTLRCTVVRAEHTSKDIQHQCTKEALSRELEVQVKAQSVNSVRCICAELVKSCIELFVMEVDRIKAVLYPIQTSSMVIRQFLACFPLIPKGYWIYPSCFNQPVST